MAPSASRLKDFQLALLPATTHADRATPLTTLVQGGPVFLDLVNAEDLGLFAP